MNILKSLGERLRGRNGKANSVQRVFREGLPELLRWSAKTAKAKPYRRPDECRMFRTANQPKHVAAIIAANADGLI